MNNRILKIFYLIIGIIMVILSVIVFLFASGIRRWYSGAFFLIIGIVILLNSIRWLKAPKE